MSSRRRLTVASVVVVLAVALAAGVTGTAQTAFVTDGVVSGVVSRGGVGLGGVQVSAYRYDPVDDHYYWAGVDEITADDGTYELVLTPGDYRLRFEDQASSLYVAEAYGDARDVNDSDAETVTVSDGGSTVADADLAPAGHVAGTVTGPTGEPVEGVHVFAFREHPDDGTVLELESGAVTDAQGAYDIGSLRAGNYRIRFGEELHGDEPTDLATTWYAGGSSSASAATVTVGPAQTVSTIDSHLVLDGEVAGTVTDVDGAALEHVEVEAYVLDGSTWVPVSGASTASNGAYVLDGLAAGTYRVGFRTDDASEYWKDTGLLANATSVTVGQDLVAGIDADLVAGEHDGETEQPTPSPTAAPSPPPPVISPPVVSPPVATPPVVPPVVPQAVDVPTALAKALAAVRVTGRPKVGKTVKVAGLDLDLRTAVTYRFRWYAGAKKIRKATRSRLKVLSSMKGKKLSVTVTGTAGSTSKSVKLKVGKVT